jgi:hypothetical protein
VPLDLVSAADREVIQLNCQKDEIGNLTPLFQRLRFLQRCAAATISGYRTELHFIPSIPESRNR